MILHIVFAIRLDHELGREFLKSFKVTYNSSVGCWSYFCDCCNLEFAINLELIFYRHLMGTCALSVLP